MKALVHTLTCILLNLNLPHLASVLLNNWERLRRWRSASKIITMEFKLYELFLESMQQLLWLFLYCEGRDPLLSALIYCHPEAFFLY